METITETMIDSVETAKSKFAKTFITNEAVLKSVDSYIAAETAFAKSVVKFFDDVYKTVKVK